MAGTREQRLVPGEPPFWTDERVAILKARFHAGDSFSQIAKLIGHGATRNSCIGKCTRLGWVRVGAAPLNAGARSKPRQLGKAQSLAGLRLGGYSTVFAEPKVQHPPRFTAPVAAFEPLPGSSPRPWTDRLSGMCCWPVGDEGQGERSCCLPVVARGWCKSHLQRGQAPARITRREDQRIGIVPMRRAG